MYAYEDISQENTRKNKGLAMNEDTPPVKLRKLKKWDEYKQTVPRAWKIYENELANGIEPREASLKAVKMVYPGDKNSSTTLRIWEKYGLWPPPKEILSDRTTAVMSGEQSRNQGKNGLTVISGGGRKRLKSPKEHSENGRHEPELSEREVLQSVLKILDKIEVRKREWTGWRRKRYSPVKTKVIAGRLPVALLNELHVFKGTDTYHLERSLRLYVKVMGARE